MKPDIIEYKKLNIDQAKDAPHDSVKAQLEMWKIPFGFEYILYSQEPWQFSVPVDLGYGASYYSYFDKYGQTKKLNYHHVVDLEAGVSAQYIILKWVGIGVGAGYRLTLIKNQDIKHDFSSPVYSIKLKLFLGAIYRSIFPPK